MWSSGLIEFINRCCADQFDGTELYFDSVNESPDEIKIIHDDKKLILIGQILTKGNNIDGHIDSFKRQAEFAINSGSILVNVHAGKDYFAFEDNCKLFAEIIKLSDKVDIPFFIETHRGRATYSLIETCRFLNEFPTLKLTADFSHWMVVHESDLSDQGKNLEFAISRSHHIHARVGYEEGPQITDLSAPEWENNLNRHFEIWSKIISAREEEGKNFITITPEFGPPNYMHTVPFSNEPVRDPWKMNLKMRSLLKSQFNC